MNEGACELCEGVGFYSELYNGIYPFPCRVCSGVGIITPHSREIRKFLDESYIRAYSEIDKICERRKLASTHLEKEINWVTNAETRNKKEEALLRMELQMTSFALGSMPEDYFKIEGEQIEGVWASIIGHIDSSELKIVLP